MDSTFGKHEASIVLQIFEGVEARLPSLPFSVHFNGGFTQQEAGAGKVNRSYPRFENYEGPQAY
jgi:hypothetical protein